MLPPRTLALLVILLAVQGLCKPTKSNEDNDYEDDTPFDIEEEDEDVEEETDNVADAPPQMLSTPLSIRAKAGSTVLLPCHVIHGENNAITWMKNNDYLYFGGQPYTQDIRRIVKLSNNSLVIYNVSESDSSDNYKCAVLLADDSLMVTHRLLVDPEKKPVIHQQSPQHSHKGIIRVTPSKRIEVNQGHTVRLGCETDMQPQPEIKWFMENKKVVNGYNPDIIVDDNFLTIRNVNKSNSGRYQCLAEDGSKMPAMEAIIVIVHYVPEIEVKRDIVYSGASIESEMTCIVSAYPEAIITWSKDDKEVFQKKASVMIHHGVMKNNKTKHVLKILHTLTRDFGEYKCHAQNAMGQNTKSILLTGIPSQPKPIGAEMTNDDMGIILKWHMESYSPIKEYKLQYRRVDEAWSIVEPEVKNGKGNQFTVEYMIRDLQPGSYEAVLMARNTFGWSLPSESHMFSGDSPPEMARKGGNAAVQIRPPGALLALILVVLSCAFPSL